LLSADRPHGQIPASSPAKYCRARPRIAPHMVADPSRVSLSFAGRVEYCRSQIALRHFGKPSDTLQSWQTTVVGTHPFSGNIAPFSNVRRSAASRNVDRRSPFPRLAALVAAGSIFCPDHKHQHREILPSILLVQETPHSAHARQHSQERKVALTTCRRKSSVLYSSGGGDDKETCNSGNRGKSKLPRTCRYAPLSHILAKLSGKHPRPLACGSGYRPAASLSLPLESCRSMTPSASHTSPAPPARATLTLK